MEREALVYFTAASATAALHALIPDHWLPFVLMAKSRRWSLSKTLALASASGLLHVFLAVGLGLLVAVMGREGAQAAAGLLGERLEVLSSGLLALFGFLYGFASWRRERRHHPPQAEHADHEDHQPGGSHHHGHLLERWLTGSSSGLSLVLVIGLSPCALALPILLASAASLEIGGVLFVAAGFGLAMTASMLAVTWAGFVSARKLDFPFFTRYGDLISGILIGLVGSAVCAAEVLGP
jgi:ABC-type nickel/cobalt efflux system permease component RcnA